MSFFVNPIQEKIKNMFLRNMKFQFYCSIKAIPKMYKAKQFKNTVINLNFVLSEAFNAVAVRDQLNLQTVNWTTQYSRTIR